MHSLSLYPIQQHKHSSMAFAQNQAYPSYSASSEPLAFFGGGASSSSSPYYAGSRSSLEGNVGGSGGPAYASGNMGSMAPGRMGSMGSMGEGRWWEAFGTGGFEGEPTLMEGALGGGGRLVRRDS